MSRSAGRRASGRPRCRTSTSTTARSRASSSWRCRAAPCSTTPRQVPGRTTACICSIAFWSALPRRSDIQKILILGSGPIVIGQAAEFDYSGVQACKVLREESYEVVLVNSNPATIMTDPEFADATYIEPITPEAVEKIIEREKPDALLPTLGGQTGLNTAMALWRNGVLQKHGVEMIGAKAEAIEKGEDRLKFKQAMQKIGLDLPLSGVAHTVEEAREVARTIGRFPVIIRPAYTLGGTGGGIAYNREEFDAMAQGGIEASPVSEILVEESLIGWKEYE